MKCIKTITDEDFGLKMAPFKEEKHRFGARGLVFNEKEQIAILYKKKQNEYKLIGGGIENSEEPIEAFKREVLEEAGCKIEIDNCLGTVEEFKSKYNFKQTSYVYVSHVIENIGYTNYTKQELDDDSELLWMNIDDAIKLIKECENQLTKLDSDDAYQFKFIARRDYEILNYYKTIQEDSKIKKLNR